MICVDSVFWCSRVIFVLGKGVVCGVFCFSSIFVRVLGLGESRGCWRAFLNFSWGYVCFNLVIYLLWGGSICGGVIFGVFLASC